MCAPRSRACWPATSSPTASTVSCCTPASPRAGQRAALLCEVHEPDRLHVQPALHRGDVGATAASHVAARRAVRGALRPGARRGRPDRRVRDGRRRGARRARRRAVARRGPHRAHVPVADPRHRAHERLPRPPDAGVQVRPVARARSARPGRSTRSSCARRESRVCTCAAADRPRRPALERPPGGLPHRGARSREGADGEERGDRAGRRQGRIRGQAAEADAGGERATRASSATGCSSAACST